jgi:hypothetical protein
MNIHILYICIYPCLPRWWPSHGVYQDRRYVFLNCIYIYEYTHIIYVYIYPCLPRRWPSHRVYQDRRYVYINMHIYIWIYTYYICIYLSLLTKAVTFPWGISRQTLCIYKYAYIYMNIHILYIYISIPAYQGGDLPIGYIKTDIMQHLDIRSVTMMVMMMFSE